MPRIRTRPQSSQGVLVEGLDDTWIKLSRCCMPVPGDNIVGFITRGRGVSVHRQDCSNIKSLSESGERFVSVTWDPLASGVFLVAIQVEALDRAKLLRDVTTTISDFGMNILSATSSVGQGLAVLRFTFELAGRDALPKILASIRKVESVYDAYRITPSQS